MYYLIATDRYIISTGDSVNKLIENAKEEQLLDNDDMDGWTVVKGELVGTIRAGVRLEEAPKTKTKSKTKGKKK